MERVSEPPSGAARRPSRRPSRPPSGYHRVAVHIPSASYGLVVGAAHVHVVDLVRRVGEGTTFQEAPKPPHDGPAPEFAVLTLEGPNLEAVQDAAAELDIRAARLAAVRPRERRPSAPPTAPPAKRERYIFVDNSNVLLGAQRGDPSSRIAPIAALLQGGPGETLAQRVVVGSDPPMFSSMWDQWLAAGYTVEKTQRGIASGKEMGTDQVLQVRTSPL